MTAAHETWQSHPLCGPRETLPDRYWGPEPFNPEAWRELEPLFDPSAEITAILDALGDSTDAVDVGGGTGLLTQAVAKRMPVLVIEPSSAQREQLPPGITAREGRIEALPLADRSHDAALATWVLQYTADPLRAVSELARVARRRVVIVQGAPGNDLITLWNIEGAIAGMPFAHHGFLLAHAAEILERAGFSIELSRIPIAVAAPSSHRLADIFARLHFWKHPRLADMIAATEPVIARTLAIGELNDDAVMLTARR